MSNTAMNMTTIDQSDELIKLMEESYSMLSTQYDVSMDDLAEVVLIIIKRGLTARDLSKLKSFFKKTNS